MTRKGIDIVKIVAVPLSLFLLSILLIEFKGDKIISKCEDSQVLYKNDCYEKNISCLIENGSGMKAREGDSYSECVVKSCKEGYVEKDNKCVLSTKIVISPDEYRIDLLNKKPLDIIVGNHTLVDPQYPKVIVHSDNIEEAYLRIVVDFSESYKTSPKTRNYVQGLTSDGKPAPGYGFVLRYGIGKVTNGITPYGGYFNVINRNIKPASLSLHNRITDDINLDGLTPGLGIVGGKEYLINLNKTPVANEDRLTKEDNRYVWQYPLTYMKQHKNTPLTISAWLSSASIGDTIIKEMEIIYVGDKGAITLAK